MIAHDVKQGSREWWALRLGKPTVSRFSRILTPSRLDYSKGARAFAAELIAERILGRPIDDREVESMWTARGTDMEDEARRFYEFHRDAEVTEVGFVTTDSGGIGGSPDGLVGEEGGVEIKCRSAKYHMEAILGLSDIADRLQVQGYLWLTGRKWWDVLAYNPELPKKIVRVHQDEEVQAAINNGLDRFLTELARAEERLAALGDVIEESDDIMWELIESVKRGAAA